MSVVSGRGWLGRVGRGEVESQIQAKMGLPSSKNATLEDYEQDGWRDQLRQELMTRSE